MKITPTHIKVIGKNKILNIILNRPKKKNALNPRIIQEIQDTLNNSRNNPNINSIIISSSSNTFCAGADLEYLKKIKDFSYEDNLNDSKLLMKLFQTMISYPKIIIAKVCGHAIGGGCGLVTASDIVFATDNSKFAYPEVKIGFVPALVSTFLINKIGEKNARELLLTGQTIDATKAKEIGLINYIYNNDNIDEEISKLTTHIANNISKKSIAETKKMMYKWLDLNDKLKKAAEFNAKNRKTSDFKKGISGFLNKNSVNWNTN